MTPTDPLPQTATLGARVFRNTAAILSGRGLAILFSTGAAVLLVRYLGSEKLGQFGAVYAYLALYNWIASFGFEAVLTREVSREREKAGSLIHTAVVLSSILSLVTIAVAVVLAPLAGFTGFLRTLLVLAALEFVLTPLRLPAIIFQVDLRQWYAASINVIRQGLWLAIVVLLWLVKAPLVYVILGRVFCAVVESLLMWVYGRRFFAPQQKFLRERARMLLGHSFPIAFTMLLGTIYLRIDQVMLHKMTSDSVLGQYVAAVKVSELFELLPTALMSSLVPLLSVAIAQPAQFRSYIDRSFRYFMVLAAGLCVFMTAGAQPIIRLLFGRQFLPAAPMLAILIWSEIAVFFASVVVNALIASNLQNLLPLPTVVGAAINVALNLVLIPRYSAVGAAWATLISYTFTWMVFLLFLRTTRALIWQGLRFAIPITAVALFAIEATVFLPVPGFFRVFAALALFIGGIWITRMIQSSDLQYALAALEQSLSRNSKDDRSAKPTGL